MIPNRCLSRIRRLTLLLFPVERLQNNNAERGGGITITIILVPNAGRQAETAMLAAWVTMLAA
jgi:hypothetical protein